MSEINPLSGLYNDFIEIVRYSVIKYDKRANVEETMEMTKAGEQYISALYEEDNFFSYMTYDRKLLNQVGIYDETVIPTYMDNRRNIPEEYRNSLLKLKRKDVIENYVEINSYYRTLNGQPLLTDTDKDFIYIDRSRFDVSKTIPEDIPIHLMEDYQISLLRDAGVIDILIEENPTKEYLKYLGADRIPIDIARRAKNFELLRIPTEHLSDATRSNFSTIYEQCRYYFMNVIYVQEYTSIMDYYDEFMSMCIMFMAIEQVIARSIDIVINRDFFDEQLIKMLYDSYKMPYLSELPFNVQKNIARNLNMLIQYKSTDKVLYDISALLGYDSVSIYKYYLIKEQKFDSVGNPVIATKEIINQEGERETVPDYEAMYDIYFRQIELTERDYFKAMQNENKTVSYHEIVDSDPYWWEDDELYNMIYESEYNYIETKYLGMNLSYKLTEIMFETVYLIRMLFDKKTEIANIKIDIPKVYEDSSIGLFECVILLCAIICKKNNIRGEILMTPSKILHVLGFNFKQDFDLIKQHIKDDPLLSNDMLIYLENMSAYTVDSVNNLYKNIGDLRDFMTEKMASSTDIDEYRAYCKLYEALYISEENEVIFDISDYTDEKQYPDTYEEYLKHAYPHLYDVIQNVDDETLTAYAQHIITRMNVIIEDIKYLYILCDMNTNLLDAFITLIRFFKSYTTDMINLNIIYIFDTKALNMLKLIDKIEYISKDIECAEIFNLTHNDIIELIDAKLYLDDHLKIREEYKLISEYNVYDELIFHDDIEFLDAFVGLDDKLNMYDYLSLDKSITGNSTMSFSDTCRASVDMSIQDDGIRLSDAYRIESVIMPSDTISFFDNVESISKTIHVSDGICFTDKVSR